MVLPRFVGHPETGDDPAEDLNRYPPESQPKSDTAQGEDLGHRQGRWKIYSAPIDTSIFVIYGLPRTRSTRA